MTIKSDVPFGFIKDTRRWKAGRQQFFRAVSKTKKQILWLKIYTHTQTQYNKILQPSDFPMYSKTKNLFKAGIFI